MADFDCAHFSRGSPYRPMVEAALSAQGRGENEPAAVYSGGSTSRVTLFRQISASRTYRRTVSTDRCRVCFIM
jgi:hypothetical protein